MSAMATWWLAELALSFILWAIYRVGASRLRHPGDRYFFLCLAFLVIPFVPWLAFSPVRTMTGLPSALVSASGAAVSVAGAGWPSPLAFLVGLYLTIIAVKGGRLLNSLFAFRRLRKGVKGPLIFHEESLPPVSVGFWRPHILLSRPLFAGLSPRQRRMVLAHERGHLARFDGLFNLLRLTVRDLLFFSPFIAWLARDFEEEMELSIDAAVLGSGRFAPREYGALLLYLSDRLASPTPGLRHGLFLSHPFIKRRIRSMKDIPLRRKPTLSFLVGLVFCLIGLAGVSALGLGGSGAGLEFYLGEPRGTPVLSGPDFASARVEKCDPECVLSLTLKPRAVERFSQVTGENVGKALGIYFAGKRIQAPVIKQRISGPGMMISGKLTPETARELVARINEEARH